MDTSPLPELSGLTQIHESLRRGPKTAGADGRTLQLHPGRLLLSPEEEAMLKVTYSPAPLYNSLHHGARVSNPMVWLGKNIMLNYNHRLLYAWLRGPFHTTVNETGERPERELDGFPGIPEHRGVSTKIAWLERSAGRGSARLRGFIPNADDGRTVVWRDVPHVVFSRYSTRTQTGHKTYKTLWLARLVGEPPWPQLELTLEPQRDWEGNWLPFVWGGQLWLSYSLCPRRVLEVNATTGVCRVAHESPSVNCTPAIENGDRLSSNGFVDDEGLVVGLGHARGRTRQHYWHFFFRREAQPPFRVIARSADFRFPSFFHSGRHKDGMQFCISVRRPAVPHADSYIIMDYSTMDAAALTVNVSRSAYCNFTAWC